MSKVIDEEYAKIPDEFTGLMGWKIIDFKLVPVEELGKFHTGDSDIILHAYRVGASMRIIRDIFFWLGSTSTQDERGTAAIKTVELDDFFGGSPIQHREIQYHESEAFLRLFDATGGIQYLDGGVPSAFRKINIEKTIDMFMIKGKRDVLVKQIPPSRSSLCHGNCYIIHTPGQFFVWIGKNSSILEKNKTSRCLDIIKGKDPKADIIRIDGEENEELNALIGAEGEIPENDENDAKFEASFKRIIYDDKFEVIAEGKNVDQKCLSTNAVNFYLYGEKIFAHVGKKATPESKKSAVIDSIKLIEKLGLPDYTGIEVVHEGTDDDDFQCAF